MIIKTIGSFALLAYMISVAANVIKAEDKKREAMEIINNKNSKKQEES